MSSQSEDRLVTLEVPQRRTQKNYNLFRCDRMQIPEAGPFTSDVLEWFPVRGVIEAFIPRDRVKDFTLGEAMRDEVRTKWRLQKTDDRVESVGRKTVRYHCHFGPNDLRNVPLPPVPKKRTELNGGRPLARSTKLGTSSQRGCLCHFAIVYLEDRPEAALIRWFNRNHVDKLGKECHGPLDALAIYAHAHVAPSISEGLREEIERMLRAGVKADVILAEHSRELRLKYDGIEGEEPEDWSRDDQLSERDIINIKKTIDKHLYMYSQDDAVCVKLWVEQNPKMVILYQAQDKKVEPKLPFMLVWSTPWMLKKLARFGHNGAIAMDATFATNTYEFSLFTVMAFDDFQNGIPCVYGLLERHRAVDLVRMLTLVKSKAEECRANILKLPDKWMPTSIIIDVAAEEQLALRQVLPNVPIMFCLWHVRRAWETNLHVKVKNVFAKAQINEELGKLMYYPTFEEAEAASIAFVQKWSRFEQTCSFATYYWENWHPKLSRWVKSFRQFKHANQNTNGAIEKSHSTMKRYLNGEKKVKSGRKIGWLIHMLTHTVEPFFWAKSARKWQGCIRNKIVETSVLNAINLAKDIPDGNVVLETRDGKQVGFVRSTKNPTKWHETVDYDKDQAACSCIHSLQGNTCSHTIKCLLMTGWHESTLLMLLGTKMGTMCGGLDYAKNLVETQLGRDITVPNPEPAGLDLNVALPNDEDLLDTQATISDTPEEVHMAIPTASELHKVLDEVVLKMQGSEWHMMHAGSTLQEWKNNMLGIVARSQISAEDANRPAITTELPSLNPIQRLPGGDNSTKRLLGIVDRVHKGHRGKRGKQPIAAVNNPSLQTEGNENVHPNTNPAPFVRKKILKENMTNRMYRHAFEELNDVELAYDDTTGNPVERKKVRKRGKELARLQAEKQLQELMAFNEAYQLGI